MRRAIHLMLIIGALVGMIGQGVAYASAPSFMTMSGGAENCDQMMKQQPDGKPCKSMEFNCVTAIGCVAPTVLLDASLSVQAPELSTAQAFWVVVALLHGRDLAPEQEPPIAIG